MSKKAKLKQLHMDFQKESGNESQANPARGTRGDFLKVTITLPPNTLAELKRLGIERRLDNQKDTDVSSLIRESLADFLMKPS